MKTLYGTPGYSRAETNVIVAAMVFTQLHHGNVILTDPLNVIFKKCLKCYIVLLDQGGLPLR